MLWTARAKSWLHQYPVFSRLTAIPCNQGECTNACFLLSRTKLQGSGYGKFFRQRCVSVRIWDVEADTCQEPITLTVVTSRDRCH
jgi:hypothetical protein